MSTRKLNAAFAQLIQARNAIQANQPSLETVSLEAVPGTDGEDPTVSNPPDPAHDDDATGDDLAVTDPTATDATDAAPNPVVDPTVAVTDPAVDPVGDPAIDPTAAAVTDPVVDPTAPTDPAAVTDPVADTVANASAGDPAVAAPAEVGAGTEPTKIVIEVNVNTNPTESAEAPAIEPAMDGPVTEDVLVDPVTGATVVDPDAAVVVTEPVSAVTDDGVVSMTDAATPGYTESNILSEEELKTIQIEGDGAREKLKVIDETTVKITELEGEISQYEAGHQSMKKMTEVLDTSDEEGGITDNAAQILKIAVEHISNQLGMGESVLLGIPSLESFALPSSRQSATSLALEDIKETVQKIWAAIQAGYAKVMEWLGNFFKHITDANVRLAARATAIQAAAAKLTTPIKSDSFDNPKIAKSLAKGQKVSQNVVQELDALNKFVVAAQTGSSALFQQLSALVKKVEGLVMAADGSDDAIKEAEKEMNATVEKYINSLATAGGLKINVNDPQKWYGLAAPTDAQNFYTSSIWLGNKIVFAYVPKDNGFGYRAGQATADVGEVAPACRVLTAKEIASIAGLVLEYTKAAQAANGVWAGMQDVYKTVMAGAQAANAAGNLQGQNTLQKFKEFSGFIKDARAISSGIQQPAIAIAAATNGAALDYAAVSLKALGAVAPALPAPAGAVPATEGIDDTLSMEGVFDTLKAKFSMSDEAKFARDIKSKKSAILEERKKLEQAKSQVSQSTDTGTHKVNLKRAADKMNFSANTVEEVIAGVAKNRKFVEKLMTSFKNAKTKEEATTAYNVYKEEMSKKGVIKEEMMTTRALALKYLDESIAYANTMEKFLDIIEELSKKNISTEGVGSILSSLWNNFKDVVNEGWHSGAVSFVLLILFCMNIYLIFLLVKATVRTLKKNKEEPATEGIDDTLTTEGLVDDFKKRFSTSDEAVFARELEAKHKALKKERENLDKIKLAVTHSEATEAYSISLKKMQGKWNFSASTPAQLIAGISKNVKFIEATAAKVAKVKSKAEAEAIQATFKAEMEKTGSVPETMTFNKSQVEAYLTECIRAIDAMEKYLNALGALSKVQLSSEAFGDLGLTILKVIGAIVAGEIFWLIASFITKWLVTAIALANPFLGIGVGLVLLGIQLVGYYHTVKNTYKYLDSKLGKKDDESSSGMTPAAA